MIWVDVKGYEGLYQVSESGKVRNTRTGLVRKTHTTKWGYEQVVLHNKGLRKGITVHRIVAKAYIGNPYDKPQVNHKDGNKLNNHRRNLEWATSKENIKHAYDTGLLGSKTGTANHNFKGVIKARHVTSGVVTSYVGKNALVSAGFDPSNVYKVINGKSRTYKGHFFLREVDEDGNATE